MRRATKILIAIGSAVGVLLILAVIGVVVAGLLTNWFRGNEPNEPNKPTEPNEPTKSTEPNEPEHTRVRVFATNRTHMFQEIAALQFLSGQQPNLTNRVLVKPSILYVLYNRHSENSR